MVVDRLENLEPDALEVSDASIRSESLPVLHAGSSFGPVVTALFFGALGLGGFAGAWWCGACAFLHGATAQSLTREVDIFSSEMNDSWVQVAGAPQPFPPQDAQMDVDMTCKDARQS